MENDINYSMLNKDIFEAFLVDHMKKEIYALLCGARQSKYYLSSSFCTLIETFLECVSKKGAIIEKQGGKNDKKD